MIRQIIYTSLATRPFQPDELIRLLQSARDNNTRRGITGMLVHADGDFLQVVEGTTDGVEMLIARITADERHRGLRIVSDRLLADRSFPDWRMAFRDAGALDLEGFDPFFVSGARLADVQAGAATRILEAFAALHP